MATYMGCALRCARCGASSASSIVVSSSTIGAQRYSDGFMMGPALAIDDLAVRCPQCGLPSLKDDLDVDHSINVQDRRGRSRRKAFSRWMVVQPESCASAKLWRTEEQEIAIRMAVWHGTNHRYRQHPQGAPERSAEETENMRALECLLDTTQIPDRILSAEIFRELGLFAACIWKLQSCASADFDCVIRPIRDAAVAGITSVIRLE